MAVHCSGSNAKAPCTALETPLDSLDVVERSAQTYSTLYNSTSLNRNGSRNSTAIHNDISGTVAVC